MYLKPLTENKNGETPMSIAKHYGFGQCEELLRQGEAGKLALCEHVEFFWGLSNTEGEDNVDFSDDDLDDNRIGWVSVGRVATLHGMSCFW